MAQRPVNERATSFYISNGISPSLKVHLIVPTAKFLSSIFHSLHLYLWKDNCQWFCGKILVNFANYSPWFGFEKDPGGIPTTNIKNVSDRNKYFLILFMIVFEQFMEKLCFSNRFILLPISTNKIVTNRPKWFRVIFLIK